MSKKSLTKDDWIKAAFDRLEQHGSQGMTVVALAADLSATKGSFYWHFKDLGALKAALVDDFETRVADSLQPSSGVNPLEDLLSGFDALRVNDRALRSWARSSDDLAQALARIDRRRLDAIASVLEGMDHDVARLPRVIYAAWLGLDVLERSLNGAPDRMTHAIAAHFSE